MQILHFCQVRSVHAIPPLLPGGMCACKPFPSAWWCMCASPLLCQGGCVPAMPSHMPNGVCAWHAIPSLLPDGVWVCKSFTFARLEVCLQSLHMCRTGCVHAVASHLLDWCVWVQSSHWGAHTRKHPHLQSGTSDRLAHPHTTWQKRNNCLHTPLGMCEVSTLAVWHK